MELLFRYEVCGMGYEEGNKMAYEDFYDLEVWKKAKEIVITIYQITKDFPKEEGYGLTSQLRRSSSSICANIAEGFSRYHTKDKIKFYYNARGSISESMSHILIAQTIGYLNSNDGSNLLNELRITRKMLNMMINSIAGSVYFKKK